MKKEKTCSTNLQKLYEIEQQLITFDNIVNKIKKRMRKTSVRIMGFPINMSQLKVMSAFREGKQLTMGDLCKIANVKMPTMTEMVDKLEAEGFLKRKRDTKDRRVVKVIITAKGGKIHKELLNRRDDEIENLYGNLSTTDRDKLTRALRTVLSILERIINKYYI